VKQQQEVQHCSAVAQPQGQDWQGNGSANSLSTRTVARGSGMAAAQKHTSTQKVVTFRENAAHRLANFKPVNLLTFRSSTD
jgi:hypothetical protein